jgi:hypothetical protein
VRKRLVIGVIAAVVVGVAAYVLWEPGKERVEFHKERYLRCAMSLSPYNQETFIERNAPASLQVAIWRFMERRRKHHRDALIRRGYLAQLTLVPSNAPPGTVMSRVYMSLWGITGFEPDLIPEKIDRSFFEWENEAKLSRIICLRTDVDALQRAFAAADVDDATWEAKTPKTSRYE